MLPTNVGRLSSLATILLLTLLTSLSQAFFPTLWKEQTFGNNGVSHIEQTEQAFQTLATRYFPTIKSLSKSMLSARDTIAEANADVDKDQITAALHCDDESFDDAQVRLMTLQGQIVDFLTKDNPAGARKALGSALHTVQDFYAHSNWVELGNLAISDVLGRAMTISHAQPTDLTCGPCAPHNSADITDSHCLDCRNNEVGFTSLLTSGYYFGEDASTEGIPAFKCHHGGYTDNSLGSTIGFITPKFLADPLGGINKDSLNCGWSPHAYAHTQAVAFAIDATIQYIDDIKQKIPESQLRQLFGVGSTLAFVIDTTGSMSDIEDAVTALSIAIVTERIGTPDEPSSYVVSPFNDPGTGPVTTTSDFSVFSSTLQSLTASGGGDCPELSMGGIFDAIAVLDEGSVLFMFTDAASKDAARAGDVISAATAKYVNIYIFKFDSNCDDLVIDKREDAASDEVYSAVALATGGQYYSLPRSEVATIGGIIDSLTSVDNSFILRVKDGLTTVSSTYTVPVDSYMTQLAFSLRGVGLSITVNQPSGTPLDLTAATVASVILSDGSFVTVQTPVAGYWTVTVSGTGDFSLDVTGISAVHFASFNFAALAGRPGHTGYFPIDTLPPYNVDVAAIADMSGPFMSAIFTFRNPTGIIATTLEMTSGSGDFGDPPLNSYFTLLRLSPDDKYVYVNGFDTAGAPYQRLIPSLITPVFSNEIFIVDNNTSSFTTNLTTVTTSICSTSSIIHTTSGTGLFGNGTSTIVSPPSSASSTSSGFLTVSTSSTFAPFANGSMTTSPSITTTRLSSLLASTSLSSIVSSTVSRGNNGGTGSTSSFMATTAKVLLTSMSSFHNSSRTFSSTSCLESTSTTGGFALSTTASSGSYNHTTATNLPTDTSDSTGFTITEIVYTTTTFCPLTASTTISGTPTFVVTGSISTVTLTSTVVVPCNKCLKPSSVVTLSAMSTSNIGQGYAAPSPSSLNPVTITEIIYTVTTLCLETIGTSTVSGTVSYRVTNTISIVTLTAKSTASCDECGPHYATVTVLLLGVPSPGGREYTPTAVPTHPTPVHPTRVYSVPSSKPYGYGSPSSANSQIRSSSSPVTITVALVSPPYVPVTSRIQPLDNSDTVSLATTPLLHYGPEETHITTPVTIPVSFVSPPYLPITSRVEPPHNSNTFPLVTTPLLAYGPEETHVTTPVTISVSSVPPPYVSVNSQIQTPENSDTVSLATTPLLAYGPEETYVTTPVTISVSSVPPPYVSVTSRIEPPDNSDTFPLTTTSLLPYGPGESDVITPPHFTTVTPVSSPFRPYGPEKTDILAPAYSGPTTPYPSPYSPGETNGPLAEYYGTPIFPHRPEETSTVTPQYYGIATLDSSTFPPYGSEETNSPSTEYTGTVTSASSPFMPYGPGETNSSPNEYPGTVIPTSPPTLISVFKPSNSSPGYSDATPPISTGTLGYGPVVVSSIPSELSTALVSSEIQSTGPGNSDTVPPDYFDVTILVLPTVSRYGLTDSIPTTLQFSSITTTAPAETAPVIGYATNKGVTPSANPVTTDTMASSTPGYHGPLFTGSGSKNLDVFAPTIALCIMLAGLAGMIML